MSQFSEVDDNSGADKVRPSSVHGAIGSLRQQPVLLAAILVLATLLLYAPAAHYDFIQSDDIAYVTGNMHVRTGLTSENVAWAFRSVEPFYWHPLTWLSHMADCQFFGLNSGAHHAVNILLHLANVVLLFLLLQKATGAVWRSFLVAALFAMHPLNVETVAWVAERKSLLSALFSLLTIAAYGWYVQRPDWKEYLGIVAVFSLALMSKPMAVTLPLVLLLLDCWPLQRCEELPFVRRFGRLFLEKLPLFLLSAASSSLTVLGQHSEGAVVSLSALPLSMRLQNAAVSYVAYLGKLIWPVKLAAFYPHPASKLAPGGHLPWVQVIASVVVLLGFTALVLRARRLRYLAMGWFLFLLTLVPVIGIVQAGMVAMADRFAYLPYIGLFIIVAWGMCDLAEKLPLNRVLPALATACFVLALAFATAQYLPCWQNGVKLFENARMVAGQPDPVIEQFLGDALFFSGRPDDALQHYRNWCGLLPTVDLCHYNIAQVLFGKGEVREALEEYRLASNLTRNRSIALLCLERSGEALLALGDYAAADTQFAAALQIDPNDQTALLLRQQTRSLSGGSR